MNELQDVKEESKGLTREDMEKASSEAIKEQRSTVTEKVANGLKDLNETAKDPNFIMLLFSHAIVFFIGLHIADNSILEAYHKSQVGKLIQELVTIGIASLLGIVGLRINYIISKSKDGKGLIDAIGESVMINTRKK
jgi:hypothetical protein